MLSEQSERGHASRLDSLSAVMDLEGSCVRGHGRFRIDERGRTPSLIWIPDQTSGFSSSGQDDGGPEGRFRALARSDAEAVALGRTSNPILDAAEPGALGEKADAYTSRIRFLKNEAVDDGYVLNLPSEIDFWQFVRSSPDIRQGSLVLMDTGNLRAIWKDEQGSRLGLQFLGGKMVQYVIFKWRNHGQSISRVSGRDSLQGLARQIDAFELWSLLSE